MTSSISGTAAPSSLPIPFSLSICATSQRVADRESTSQRKDERARQLAIKRKLQHEVEMLALEWKKTLLERHIYESLDPATDPRLRRDLRKDVMDLVKIPEDEDAKKQKGLGVGDFLEALAAASAIQGAIERTPPAQRIEHTIRDVTPRGAGEDLQQLLDDLNNDEELDDEKDD